VKVQLSSRIYWGFGVNEGTEGSDPVLTLKKFINSRPDTIRLPFNENVYPVLLQLQEHSGQGQVLNLEKLQNIVSSVVKRGRQFPI
jgi:hypothetical protein